MAEAAHSQVYRRRRPERSVAYRALTHHFERFLQVYEDRFEPTFGYLRSVVARVVYRYLDCGLLEQGQPQEICTVADKAQLRLHRRYLHFVLGSSKPAPKAVVAMARELVGFLWDVLYLYPRLQEGTGTN